MALEINPIIAILSEVKPLCYFFLQGPRFFVSGSRIQTDPLPNIW